MAGHVEAMARDIAAGRWMFNAQPICFARNGRLLNGQHRLNAVIAAGQPVEVLVLRGLDEAAYETYDMHRQRGPQIDDLLEGCGDRALVAAAAGLLWRREMRPIGAGSGARPTAAELRAVVERYPDLVRFRGWGRKVGALLRSSVAIYLAIAIRRDDPELGEIFLERLETGAELPPSHPILKLRERLRDLRQAKAAPGVVIDETLKVWAAFRARPGLDQGRSRRSQ